jgi:hypothetical protein
MFSVVCDKPLERLDGTWILALAQTERNIMPEQVRLVVQSCG